MPKQRVLSQTVVNSAEPMSTDLEILYDAVHRCEALQMGGRREPAHLPLPRAVLVREAQFNRLTIYICLCRLSTYS